MTRLIAKLGVNYVFGVLNFTLGVIAGGTWVAVALVGAGVVK